MGTVEDTLASLIRDHLPHKGKALLYSLTTLNTKGNGKKEKCTDTENLVGMTALHIKANTNTAANMEKELLCLFQKSITKENGPMANKTAKEPYSTKMVQSFIEEFGTTACS